jgi:hypothetical protein
MRALEMFGIKLLFAYISFMASALAAQNMPEEAFETLLAPLKTCEPDGGRALDGRECFPLKVLVLTRTALQSRAPERAEAGRRLLEALWRNDTALKLDRWKARVRSDDFQSGIVELLAMEVRQGRSTVPLEELQTFAVGEALRGMRGALDPHRLKRGVLLIGVTEAPGQLPLLRRVIEENIGGARSDAIAALQYRCDRDSGSLLHELAKSKVLSAAEQETVAYATKLRGVQEAKLCRLPGAKATGTAPLPRTS